MSTSEKPLLFVERKSFRSIFMGQKEISSTYHPDYTDEKTERFFLISHPVRIGLVIPKKRDPLIADIYSLLSEGGHHRPTDLTVLYPHAGILAKEGCAVVSTTQETVVEDYISHNFHKRGNGTVTGRLGFEDLEGLQGIVLIVSPSDSQLIRTSLDRALKFELSILRGLVTIIELGDEPDTELEASKLPYKHIFASNPQQVEESIRDL